MSQGATSVDEYPLRELREYVAGRLDVDHDNASPAALIHDDEVRKVALFMENTYEPPRLDDGSIPEGFPEDF